MTSLIKTFAALTLVGFLAACVDDDHYPVTGETCAPEDPVKTLDASIATCPPKA